jgi:hypothetical protein
MIARDASSSIAGLIENRKTLATLQLELPTAFRTEPN